MENVDYNRQEIINYFYDNEFVVEDCTELNLEKLENWIETIYAKFGKNAKIDVMMSDGDGFSPGPWSTEFVPYTTRMETDEEYKTRIEKQEEDERRRTGNEYEMEMREYKRIKEKYGL